MARAEIRSRSTMDTKPFEAGMARMGQRVKTFAGGEIKALGKAFVGAFAAMKAWEGFRGLGEMTDEIRNAATAMGLTTDQSQALQFQADQMGVSFEQVQAAVIRLRDAQEEVSATGDKALMATFERLGISMKEVISLPVDELMNRVARGMDKAGTSVKDANDIFGRGAGRLKEYFAELNRQGGVQEVTIKAKDLGVVIDPAAMNNLDKSNDKIDEYKTRAITAAANLANLSDEERRAAQAREESIKTMNDQAGAQGRLEAMNKRLSEDKAKQDEKKLGKADKEKARREILEEKITVSMPQADQLQRLGSMLGTAGLAQQGEAKKQIQIAQKQAELLKKMTDLTDKIEVNTSNLQE